MEYFDVEKFDDLLPAPKGKRYLDCLSDPKGLRCYLVPENMTRGEFLEKYEDMLDERLLPIYINQGICIRQDSSFPIPGFYIVHPVTSYTCFDLLDDTLHLRTFFVIKVLRKAMRDILGISHIHMYYHEKLHKNGDVHYSLLPLYNITRNDVLLRFTLKKYLDQFSYQKENQKILEYNNKIKRHFQKIHLVSQDNQLLKTLSSFQEEQLHLKPIIF